MPDNAAPRRGATVEEHQAVLYELLVEFDRVCRQHHIPYTLYAGTAIGAVRHRGFIPWDDDADVLMLRADYERFLAVAEQTLGADYFLQKEYSEHWPVASSKLRKNNTTCLEKYHPNDEQRHQGIYIDIFPCDNAANSRLVRKLQFFASRVVIAKGLYARGYVTHSALKKVFMAACRLLPLKPFRRLALLRKRENTRLVHAFFGSTRTDKKSVYPREWITRVEEHPFRESQFLLSAHYDPLLTVMYGDYMTLPPEEDRACKVLAIFVDTERNYTEYAHYRDGMEFEVLTRSIR